MRGTDRTLYLSGQTASDADGALLHAGDMVAQYKSAWENMLDALAAADMGPENLVRLNFYTTDVPKFMELAEQIIRFHVDAGAQVASTLLGVQALYDPEAMIEIEGTAVG